MFGFTESEMDLYRTMAQDYAIRDVTPIVVQSSTFSAPKVEDTDKVDIGIVSHMILDIETIITLVTTHMAYDYAHLQSEGELGEQEILHKLHKKYEDYIFTQCIKYGLATTTETINRVIGEILLELPFMYMAVLDEEEVEDNFLEVKMDAYEKYLEDNFPEDMLPEIDEDTDDYEGWESDEY